MYRYGAQPTEAAMRALGHVREVYGIRHLEFNQAAQTVRLEYDATRLTEPTVHKLLRGAGLDIVERVSLIPPQPEPVTAPASV
jgi:hypothetical protein